MLHAGTWSTLVPYNDAAMLQCRNFWATRMTLVRGYPTCLVVRGCVLIEIACNRRSWIQPEQAVSPLPHSLPLSCHGHPVRHLPIYHTAPQHKHIVAVGSVLTVALVG